MLTEGLDGPDAGVDVPREEDAVVERCSRGLLGSTREGPAEAGVAATGEVGEGVVKLLVGGLSLVGRQRLRGDDGESGRGGEVVGRAGSTWVGGAHGFGEGVAEGLAEAR